MITEAQRHSLSPSGRDKRTGTTINPEDEIINPKSDLIVRTNLEILQATRSRVGGKAFNLAFLSENNIPVPQFISVTTQSFKLYRSTGQVPENVVKEVEAVRRSFGGKIAIRSSANLEDGASISFAGVFVSEYLDESSDIATVIRRIYDQALSREVAEYAELHGIEHEALSMGLVIQELVEPDTAGVMYTNIHDRFTLFQTVNGFGEGLVNGEDNGSQYVYDDQGRRIVEVSNRNGSISEDQAAALIHIQQQVVKLYGNIPQDIEFVLKDDTIYIVQSRPHTTEVKLEGLEPSVEETLAHIKESFIKVGQQEMAHFGTDSCIFSKSNFTELLPAPQEMDFGVFSYIFVGRGDNPGAIQLGRNEMGYQVRADSNGFMHYIGGQPYFTVTQDALTYYAGLPDSREQYIDTLVREYLDKVNKDPSLGVYPEIYLYLQDPTYEDLSMRFGDNAETLYRESQEFRAQLGVSASAFLDHYEQIHQPETERFIESVQERNLNNLSAEQLHHHIDHILEHLRTRSCVDFVKAARLGFYYSQRVNNHLKKLYKDNHDQAELTFALLSQGLDGSRITDVNLEIASAGSEEEAIDIARRKMGHYSQEMLEIRHPRFSDDEPALVDTVRGIRAGYYISSFNLQKQQRLEVTAELEAMLSENDRDSIMADIANAQRYMAHRETVKYQFTREYALIRKALVKLEALMELPEGNIFYVYPWELKDLIDDPDAFRIITETRRKQYENYQKLALPVIVRANDIDHLGLADKDEAQSHELAGRFLSDGPSAYGVVVNADEFQSSRELREHCEALVRAGEHIILVAKQMNLTHDPVILISSGLILENAGIVSHGAQRARELGKGALGGIPSRSLQTGQYVELNMERRKVIIR